MKKIEDMIEEIIDKAAQRYIQLTSDSKVSNNHEWIPVEERFPVKEEYEGRGFDNEPYLRRLEIAYETDTLEYKIGYYDGYKWIDEHYDTINNVVAWKTHVPYQLRNSSCICKTNSDERIKHELESIIDDIKLAASGYILNMNYYNNYAQGCIDFSVKSISIIQDHISQLSENNSKE